MMKLLFTGIIDSLGRLHFPENIRTEYGLTSGKEVSAFAQDNMICLQSKYPSCALCNAAVGENSQTVKEKYICVDCLSMLK